MPSVQAHDWRPPKIVRLAFGALFIKQRHGLADEETVEQIREDAYMEFLLGCTSYYSKTIFDPSIMIILQAVLGGGSQPDLR
jgi:hypothetical protein